MVKFKISKIGSAFFLGYNMVGKPINLFLIIGL